MTLNYSSIFEKHPTPQYCNVPDVNTQGITRFSRWQCPCGNLFSIDEGYYCNPIEPRLKVSGIVRKWVFEYNVFERML
jgi:hypothetical protein